MEEFNAPSTGEKTKAQPGGFGQSCGVDKQTVGWRQNCLFSLHCIIRPLLMWGPAGPVLYSWDTRRRELAPTLEDLNF